MNKAFKDYFKMSMLQNYYGSSYGTQEISRGRKETKLALVNEDLSVLGYLGSQWPELKSMGIVVSIRQTDIEATTEDDLAIKFYISSKR